MRFFYELWVYLKAVFIQDWWRLVCFCFDVLGIVLFFFPKLALIIGKDEGFARWVGGGIVFFSFFLANFLLYRRLTASEINENSLLMYYYSDPQSPAVEMHYIGSESAKDLEVKIKYRDERGEEKEEVVTEFFPENDPRMFGHHFKANVLVPNEVLRFRLVQRNQTLDGNDTVLASLIGVKSGRSVKIAREFNLGGNRGVYFR